jgi:hypothetical protein
MHTSLKQKEEEKTKDPTIVIKTLYLQHKPLPPGVQVLQKRCLQEGKMHRHRRWLIIDLRFSPWRKPALSKQCLQEGHARHNQSRWDLGIFHLERYDSVLLLCCCPRLLMRCYKSRITKQSPSSPQRLATVFTMEPTCPMMTTDSEASRHSLLKSLGQK